MEVGWRLGKILDDRYKIESVVGIGGMAVVYKAYDQQLMRDVAVKVLRDDVAMDAESRKQFRNEYEAVAKLSHPNIRAVYDVVASGDTEYIVMEYVDGVNLKQYMKRAGALPWQQVLDFSIQITCALSHAHSRGIIHLDIKPQNIMLPKDGTVKIADFGIAQMDEDGAGSSDEAVGSIHYISPEQARGETVDARSDIYSLGVVMYEMLTGSLPFKGKTVEEVAMQHFSVVPEAPSALNSAVPPELEEITLQAMQPNPDDRYPSADEMLADLEDFRRQQNGSAQAQARQVVRDEVHVITKNVPRISKTGELSREGYVRRRSRAASISMLLGFALVVAFALGLFVFVWDYWLKDIFQDAERIDVASFVGMTEADVIGNEAFNELYAFDVTYVPNANYEKGMIVEQDPEAGASRMISAEGIQVKLTVSSGVEMETIPDTVINASYSDAQMRLKGMGLNVILTWEESSSVTKDYVIGSDPAPGTSIPSGSTVTLSVSAGPAATYTDVPDLIGLTKQDALLALQHKGLVCGETEIYYTSSTTEESGKVMWQNYEPGTQIVMGTPVYLQIGTGPSMGQNTSGAEGQG